MTDQPLKAFVVAMTFGNQPHQQTVVDAVMAPNDVSAVAIAVSKAHTTRAIGDMLDGMCVAELTADFITAAHRGTTPAPVLSIVPFNQADGKTETEKVKEEFNGPWVPNSPLPEGAA